MRHAGEYHVNQIPSGLGGAVIVAPMASIIRGTPLNAKCTAIKQLNRWIDDWAAGRPGDPDYVDAFTKVFDFHAENVYLIGTVGITPHLYVVKNKLANEPLEYAPSMSWKGDLLVYAAKMFIRG